MNWYTSRLCACHFFHIKCKYYLRINNAIANRRQKLLMKEISLISKSMKDRSFFMNTLKLEGKKKLSFTCSQLINLHT